MISDALPYPVSLSLKIAVILSFVAVFVRIGDWLDQARVARQNWIERKEELDAWMLREHFQHHRLPFTFKTAKCQELIQAELGACMLLKARRGFSFPAENERMRWLVSKVDDDIVPCLRDE